MQINLDQQMSWKCNIKEQVFKDFMTITFLQLDFK
jgi:hypothetical protein